MSKQCQACHGTGAGIGGRCPKCHGLNKPEKSTFAPTHSSRGAALAELERALNRAIDVIALAHRQVHGCDDGSQSNPLFADFTALCEMRKILVGIKDEETRRENTKISREHSANNQ